MIDKNVYLTAPLRRTARAPFIERGETRNAAMTRYARSVESTSRDVLSAAMLLADDPTIFKLIELQHEVMAWRDAGEDLMAVTRMSDKDVAAKAAAS